MTSLSETSMLAGSSGVTSGYTIDQSIRFDVGASPEMSRTHGTGGNTDLFTLSFWFKRGRLTTQVANDEMHIFGSGADTNNTFDIQFTKTDQIHIWDYHSGYVTRLKTNRLFRDPSAWYHLVFVYDSGNAVSSERARLYINGVRETSFENETYPSQDQNSIVGTNVTIGFGNYISYGSKYFCGYLAEAHYINGYGYGPEYFGEFKEDTDIWIPKEFEGNYGSKGFFVDGRDSSDLGDDESGNGNDLSTSGLAAHDFSLDSPTNNFCVLNPNDNRGTPGTLSEGNLKYAGAATYDNVTGIVGMSSGKWYWEVYIVDSDFSYLGVQDGGVSTTGYAEKAVALVTGDSVGTIHEDDSNSGNDSFIAENGEIVGVAVDIDNKKIWWSLDGQWYRADQASTATINQSEVEAGNQGFSFSSRSPTTGFFVPYIGNYTHATTISNFGQEGTFAGNVTAGNNTDGNGIGNFKYSVPSGFLALCTSNLGAD